MSDPGRNGFLRNLVLRILIHRSFNGVNLRCGGITFLKLRLQPGLATNFDIRSRIGVPVMARVANLAGPVPNVKFSLTLGAATCAATGTILSGEGFVNFSKPYACAIAFVLKHGSKRGPPGVQYGLCHIGFRQGRRVDVANEDGLVFTHQGRGKFV